MSIPAEHPEGIRGVVWDNAADAPAAGALVRLELAGRHLAQARTDQSGVFSFEPTGNLVVAPGRYRLVIDVHGRRTEQYVTVDVSEPVTMVGRIEA